MCKKLAGNRMLEFAEVRLIEQVETELSTALHYGDVSAVSEPASPKLYVPLESTVLPHSGKLLFRLNTKSPAFTDEESNDLVLWVVGARPGQLVVEKLHHSFVFDEL
jgi:hypothetical protein